MPNRRTDREAIADLDLSYEAALARVNSFGNDPTCLLSMEQIARDIEIVEEVSATVSDTNGKN